MTNVFREKYYVFDSKVGIGTYHPVCAFECLGDAIFGGNVTFLNARFNLGGPSNQMANVGAVALFSDNAALGNNSLVAGTNNRATGPQTFAAGTGTVASQPNQTVLGRFNVANSAGALLVVGDGSSDARRSDVLRVYGNGLVFANSFVTNAAIRLGDPLYNGPLLERRAVDNTRGGLGVYGGNTVLYGASSIALGFTNPANGSYFSGMVIDSAGDMEVHGNLRLDGALLDPQGNRAAAPSFTANNVFLLADGETGLYDLGLLGQRGAGNVGLIWDESAQEWSTLMTSQTGDVQTFDPALFTYTNFHAANVTINCLAAAGAANVGPLSVMGPVSIVNDTAYTEQAASIQLNMPAFPGAQSTIGQASDHFFVADSTGRELISANMSTGDLRLARNLAVPGSASVYGPLQTSNSLSVAGSGTISGALQAGSLSTYGIDDQGDLTVTGTAYLNQLVTSSTGSLSTNDIFASGNLTVLGVANLGTLNLHGLTVAKGTSNLALVNANALTLSMQTANAATVEPAFLSMRPELSSSPYLGSTTAFYDRTYRTLRFDYNQGSVAQLGSFPRVFTLPFATRGFSFAIQLQTSPYQPDTGQVYTYLNMALLGPFSNLVVQGVDNHLQAILHSPSATYSTYIDAIPYDGGLHTFTIVIDPAQQYGFLAYLDGSLQSDGTWACGAPDTTAVSAVTGPFSGSLYRVKMYPRALSPGEVAALVTAWRLPDVLVSRGLVVDGTGAAQVQGPVTAPYFVGNGYLLTDVSAPFANGGSIAVDTLFVANTTVLSGRLNVGNDASISGNLRTAGKLHIANAALVTGNLVVRSSMFAAGNVAGNCLAVTCNAAPLDATAPFVTVRPGLSSLQYVTNAAKVSDTYVFDGQSSFLLCDLVHSVLFMQTRGLTAVLRLSFTSADPGHPETAFAVNGSTTSLTCKRDGANVHCLFPDGSGVTATNYALDDQAHTLAVVLDLNDQNNPTQAAALYQDGQLLASASQVSGALDAHFDTAVLGMDDGTDYYAGRIYRAQFFPCALSPAQVAAVHAAWQLPDLVTSHGLIVDSVGDVQTGGSLSAHCFVGNGALLTNLSAPFANGASIAVDAFYANSIVNYGLLTSNGVYSQAALQVDGTSTMQGHVQMGSSLGVADLTSTHGLFNDSFSTLQGPVYTNSIQNSGDISTATLTTYSDTTVQGVVHAASIQDSGALSVSGMTSTTGITNAGDITTSGDVRASGSIGAGGVLNVQLQAAIGGTLSVGSLTNAHGLYNDSYSDTHGTTFANGIQNSGFVNTDALTTYGDATVIGVLHAGGIQDGGTLTVTGTTTTAGINNAGLITTNDLTASGNVAIANLSVQRLLSNSAVVTGPLTVNGPLQANAISASSTLNVAGQTYMANSLGVAGLISTHGLFNDSYSTLQGPVYTNSIQNGGSIGTNTLTTSSDTTVQGVLHAASIQDSGALAVSGRTTTTGITNTGDIITSGDVRASGSIGAGGVLNVQLQAAIGGTLNVGSLTSAHGLYNDSYSDTHGTTFANGIQNSGFVNTDTLTTYGDATVTGVLHAGGIQDGGSLSVNGDTRSNGNCFVLGNLVVSNVTTLYRLHTTGNTRVLANLTVNGNTYLSNLVNYGDGYNLGNLVINGLTSTTNLVNSNTITTANLAIASLLTANVLTANAIGIKTSPAYDLDVVGTARFLAAGNAVFINNTAPAATGAYFGFNRMGAGRTSIGNQPGAAPGGFELVNYTSSGAVGNTPITILGTGNVGVQVPSPAATLDVGGTLRVAGASALLGNLGVQGPFYASNSANVAGNLGVGGDTTTSGNSFILGNLVVSNVTTLYRLHTTGNTRVLANLTVNGNTYLSNLVNYGDAYNTGNLVINGLTSTTNLVNANTITTANLAIASLLTANVLTASAIGIRTSPAYDLDVVGTARFLAAGNAVFINNTAPAATGAYFGFNRMGAGRTSIGNQPGANPGGFELVNYTSSGTVGNVPITILGTGNVGVLTSLPAYPLDVAGTGRFVGNLIITGASTVTGVTNAGNEAIAGGLSVVGNTSVVGNLVVQNTIYTYGLAVSNTVLLPDGTAAAPSLSFTTDVGKNTGLFHPANAVLAFATAGSERMRIGPFGNLGIQTTNPAYQLDVNGTIMARANVSICASGNFAYRQDTLWNAFSAGSSTFADYVYDSNNLTTTIVRGNGRMGVQTTTPAYTLDVAGTGRFGSAMYANAVGVLTTSPAYALDVSGTGRFVGSVYANAVGISTVTPTVPMDFGASGAMFQIGMYNAPSGAGNFFGCGVFNNLINYYSGTSGGHAFWTGAGGPGTAGQGTQRMTLTSAGLLGVGTTTPAYNVDVSGTTRSTKYRLTNTNALIQSILDISGASVDGLAVMNTSSPTVPSLTVLAVGGNVGVNTVSPAYPMDIVGTTRVNTSAGATAVLLSNNTPSSGRVLLQLTPAQIDFTYGVSGGTAFPSAASARIEAIDSNYSADIRFLRRQSGSDNATMLETMRLVGSTGYVGMGTSSPAYALDVSGTGRLSQSTANATALIVQGDCPNTTVFGAAQNQFGNAQLILCGNSNTNKRLALGYDTNANFGFLQAVSAGTLYTPLSLQPAGGNLGIGTTSPAYTLDVSGSERVTGTLLLADGSANSPSLSFTSDGAFNTGIFHPADDQMAVSMGGTEKMRFTTTGVGIGTTSPGYTLDVNGTASAVTADARSGNPSGTFSANQMTLQYNGGGFRHAVKSRHNGGTNGTDNAIDLYVWQTSDGSTSVGSKQVLSATYAGVGIFTTAPAYALDVSGTARVTGAATLSGGGSLAGTFNFPTTGSSSAISWGSGPYSKIYDDGDLRISTDDIMHFYNGLTSSSPGTERLTIIANGNVGVGTTTPGYLLDVNGSARFNSTVLLGQFYTNWAGFQNSALGTTGNYAILQSSVGATLIGCSTGQYIQFGCNNSYFGTWNTTGLAVGTSANPAYTLDVAGTGHFAAKLTMGGAATGSNVSVWLNNSAAAIATLDTSGNFSCNGDVVAAAGLSDARYKENVTAVTGATDILNKLRPVRFTWKQNALNEKRRGTEDIGLIAQEVAQDYPEAHEVVDFPEAPGVHFIKYEKFVPLLIASQQALLEQAETLKGQVSNLQGQVHALKSEMETLKEQMARLESIVLKSQ